VLRGLARDDLFTVVHEQVMTDTARYADLVLPATTSMEHVDVYRSYGHHYVQYAGPVLPPQGEARANFAVFGALARKLGVADGHYDKSERALIEEYLATADGLRARNHVRAARARALGAARLAAAVPAVRERCADAVGEDRALLRDPASRWAFSAPRLRAARRGTGKRGARVALSAPVHRAAESVLPELLVQSVAALAPSAWASDRA